ncbi:MAG TPA: branched-chain amino acid ABC transporter permease [bacterium]|nr:branched-chain amino acid ABC transporter permease [bacterium]
MDALNPAFWVFVGVVAGIYGLLALALYVQFSMAGLPNFGHVAFMALAAYTMALLVIRADVALVWAGALGIAAAVALGLLLGIPSVRLRANYLAIATVAGSEMIRYLSTNLSLTGGAVGSVGMLGPTHFATYTGSWQPFIEGITAMLRRVVGGVATTDFSMFCVVWATLALLLVLFRRLEKSPWGRVMKSIREDEEAAASLGKNVDAYKLQALVLGGILGGLAGVLWALEIGVFSPDDFQPTLTFYAYLILILGGMNRIWAIPIGAVLFGVLYSGTRFLGFFPLSLVDSGERAYLRLLIVGVVLVVLMAVRPEGMFGKREELVLEK